MSTILLVASGILGVIVGSFLNVVIYRYNTGKGVGGRSMCMSCRKTLSWYELLPLVSFVIQNGRCRSCSTKLSWQYFLVELVTGFAFTLVANEYLVNVAVSPEQLLGVLFGFVLVSLLIVIAVYDIKHFIMPDVFVGAVAVLSFVQLFIPVLTGGELGFTVPSLGQITAGALLPLPFLILWLVSKGRWIGFGDIKFMVAMGWLLGLRLGITAVIFAFWIGTLWIICLYIFRSVMRFLSTRRLVGLDLHRIIGKEIPFAPFLILATLIVFISHFDLVIFLTSF